MVEAWRHSGESQAAFARRHGLQAPRVKYWVDRITDSAKPRALESAAPVEFMPVRVVEAAPAVPTGVSQLEVMVAGALVRVGRDFDVELLRRVVAALRGDPAC